LVWHKKGKKTSFETGKLYLKSLNRKKRNKRPKKKKKQNKYPLKGHDGKKVHLTAPPGGNLSEK